MLPNVDIGKFRSGSPEQRAAIAAEVGRNCETTGFLYAANHGIPDATIEAARQAARMFFARPSAEKAALHRPQGRYRGYIPLSHFSSDDQGRPLVLYEAFLQGLELDPDAGETAATGGVLSANLWPDNGEDFRSAGLAYWNAVTDLANDLLKAFALR